MRGTSIWRIRQKPGVEKDICIRSASGRLFFAAYFENRRQRTRKRRHVRGRGAHRNVLRRALLTSSEPVSPKGLQPEDRSARRFPDPQEPFYSRASRSFGPDRPKAVPTAEPFHPKVFRSFGPARPKATPTAEPFRPKAFRPRRPFHPKTSKSQFNRPRFGFPLQ